MAEANKPEGLARPVPGLIKVELALTAEQADLLAEMVDGAADVFTDMEEHDGVDVRLVADLVRNAVRAAKGEA